MPSKPKKPHLGVVTDEEWWTADRSTGSYPQPTTRSGKWLFFVAESDAFEMWAKISRATKEGRLGSESRMRTPRPGYDGRVIEVSTYDWSDATDVRRIREELRRLGCVSKIPYKADEDSKAGIYKETGYRRISKYYE